MTFAKFYQNMRDFMSVQADDTRLVSAQYSALVKQIPLIYFILLSNTWALAITHVHSSPEWLTLYIPGSLTAIGMLRGMKWYRLRHANPPYERKYFLLKQVNRFAGLFAALYSGWAMMLYPYGDVYQQCHTAFYIAITISGCVFSVTHLRSAAVVSVAIVDITFIVFFAMTGNPVFVAISFNMIVVLMGIIIIIFGIFRDFRALISEQRRTELLAAENFKLANSDSLTSLPNRRAFFSVMETSLQAALEQKQALALGMVDLDGFKLINDTYGHLVGDKLLVAVADRLRHLVNAPDLVARLGGDEFGIIVHGDCSPERLKEIGKQAIAAIEVPVTLGGDRMTVSACVGFAVATERAEDASTLLDEADFALYSAKRDARGQTVIFSDDHLHSIVADKKIERLLLQADMEQELWVQYQPIVRIPEGQVVGFEALARWTSSVLGPVSPGSFIQIAERCGLIQDITRLLLEKALTAAKRWPSDMRLSFNLSSKDIGSPEAILRVMSTVLASGFPPSRIDFEITETAIINDFAQARRSIDALRKMGCGISLDDFGTGYSSLSHLHGLPLTRIKIDHSFVRDLHENPTSLKIVKSLLTLSQDMNLDCVVEGVETRAEFEKLLEIGCTKIQGYFFSRPLDEAQAAGFFKAPVRPQPANQTERPEICLNQA